MKLFQYLSFVIVSFCLLGCAGQSMNVEDGNAEASVTLGGGGRPDAVNWSRSAVYGRNGMAATAHPLASQIAIDILKQGGSALDGAIAANAALGLMEPTGNGIGGDIFFIIWDPKTEQLYGYNGSGRAPLGRSLADLKSQIAALRESGAMPDDMLGMPQRGSLPVTVPGTVDGWFAAHERFGKLPMSDVYWRRRCATPARVFLLPQSLPTTSRATSRPFRKQEALIEELDNAAAIWFPDGTTPQTGDVFRNPDLANTLELLGEKGRAAFYEGELAEAMDGYFKRIGADMRFEDLAAHQGEWVTPGSVHYHGYDVYELPPNGQGFAALQMLNILKQIDLRDYPRGSAETFHYMVEAKRLAFEDVARYYADPAYAEIPFESLLSEAYGKERFALIDPARATPEFGPGEPKLEGEGDTTYLTVADADGMMVSLIQSNYRGMGTGLVPDGLGFMLQNRGELFSLDEGHPNVYAPGKRPFHTIIPAFVMKDGEPFMSFGLMGGAMQPQGHVQVLVNIIDFGMDVQTAGDAARFNHDGGRQPTGVHEDLLGMLLVEPGVPAETVEQLRAMGHRVEVDGTGAPFGGYQAIMRHPDGVYVGATEMRKDGTVVAW